MVPMRLALILLCGATPSAASLFSPRHLFDKKNGACGCTNDETCCADDDGYSCCIDQESFCVAKDTSGAKDYPSRCCPQWTVGCEVGSVGCCGKRPSATLPLFSEVG